MVGSLEELFVERCHDLITTAALRAMGGCKKLKVPFYKKDSMSFRSQACLPDCNNITGLPDGLLTFPTTEVCIRTVPQ